MQKPITIYSASAGAGKTYTLVQQFLLHALANRNDPAGFRHILAVTFTNKATAEMKQRIVSQLYALARIPSEATALRQELYNALGIADTELSKRAESCLHYILHQYSGLNVMTIDAFTKSIVANIAFELNLPANFGITVDDKSVIVDSVDRLFNNLNAYKRESQWIISNMRERLLDDMPWDARRDLIDFASKHLTSETYLRNKSEIEDELKDDKAVDSFIGKLRKQIKNTQDNMKQAARSFSKLLEKHGKELSEFSGGARTFSKYLSTLADGLTYSEPSAGSAFPSKTISKFFCDPEAWLTAKKKENHALQKLVDACFQPALSEIEKNRKANDLAYATAHQTLANIPSLRLMNSLGRIADLINAEHNRRMLAQMPLLIYQLVGDDDSSFVFEKAGLHLNHIMIDEFQDTSQLQWHNFKNLLINQIATAEGSCMLVGDVKQSIYRWRNADWSILQGIGKGQDFKGRVERRQLNTNWRSRKSVVEFNNKFFSSIASTFKALPPAADADLNKLAKSIYSTIDDNFKDCQQQVSPANEQKAAGSVNVMLFAKKKADGSDKDRKPTTDDPDSDEQQAEAESRMLSSMAQEVLRLHQSGLDYSKMVILLRDSKRIQKVIKFFSQESYKEIPLVSDEAFQLNTSLAANLVVNALRSIADPENRVAVTFVALQYARICRIADPDLPELAKTSADSLPFMQGFTREQLKQMPLLELVQHIITSLRLNELNDQDAYLQALLDQVLGFLDENPSDIKLFLDQWDASLCEAKVPQGEIRGIRIITIHKAKGLEAHTVFIPFCDWETWKYKGDMWCKAPQEEPYEAFPILPIRKLKETERSLYAQQLTEEKKAEFIENINLLYVAFTRAQCNLYVYAVKNAPAKSADANAAQLVPKNVDQIVSRVLGDNDRDTDFALQHGEVVAKADKRKAESAENPLQATPVSQQSRLHIFPARMKFRQSNDSRKFIAGDDGNEDEYIKEGNLLHQIFAAIMSASDMEKVVAQYERQGVFMASGIAQEARRLFLNGMKNPIIADWFGGKWEVFTESDIIIPADDGTTEDMRPDRVMTKADMTVVVDYKFGTPRPQHASQVRNYVDCLRNMGRQNVVGYLWYVRQGETRQIS